MYKQLLLIIIFFVFVSCGSDQNNEDKVNQNNNPGGLTDFQMEHGIGPVTEPIELGAIDPELAAKGEEVYKVKCMACHKLDERYIGPAQRYVAERRSPEFILNMMLNPDEMTKKHPIGQKMLQEYLAPMTNMNLTREDARSVLEFFRLKAKEGREQNLPEIPIYKNNSK